MNGKKQQVLSGVHVLKPEYHDAVRADSISQKALPNGVIEKTVLEQVMDTDLPPDLEQVLVSSPDSIDVIATAAMIGIRNSKNYVPDPVRERANTIINAIKEKSVGWKLTELPTPENLWRSDAERIISAFIFSNTIKLKAKIAMMRKWLLTGYIPETILKRNDTNRANAIAKIPSFSAALSVRESGVAIVDVLVARDTPRVMPDHFLMLGFFRSPVVVLRTLIAVSSDSTDCPYRFDAMNLICTHDRRYLDIENVIGAVSDQILITDAGKWQTTSFGLLSPASIIAISPLIRKDIQAVSQSILHIVEECLKNQAASAR